MEKSEKQKRNEIRVINIPDKTYKNVKTTAKKNCRSLQKEILHTIITNY